MVIRCVVMVFQFNLTLSLKWLPIVFIHEIN
jgi:hypothetical protein